MEKITKEECLKVAKMFTNKSDFHNKKRKYFDYAKEHNLMAEATAHMENRYCKSKYTKEDVLAIAKHYDSVLQFKREQPFFFTWVINHHCKEEILGHMEKCGNRYKRCIYAYEFPNKVCYVGLTYNLKVRDIEHRASSVSQVYRYSIDKQIEIPKPKQLTEYIDKNEAAEKEGFFYEKYLSEGWRMLNKAKTGALGWGIDEKTKYTKEFCVEYAKQFKNRRELELENRYIYHKILKRGWQNEAFSHLDNDEIERKRREKISMSKIGKKSTVSFEKASERHSLYKVAQMDDDNNVIRVFLNANDAARKVFGDINKNTSIRNCCNGKTKSYGNFLWKYV